MKPKSRPRTVEASGVSEEAPRQDLSQFYLSSHRSMSGVEFPPMTQIEEDDRRQMEEIFRRQIEMSTRYPRPRTVETSGVSEEVLRQELAQLHASMIGMKESLMRQIEEIVRRQKEEMSTRYPRPRTVEASGVSEEAPRQDLAQLHASMIGMEESLIRQIEKIGRKQMEEIFRRQKEEMPTRYPQPRTVEASGVSEEAPRQELAPLHDSMIGMKEPLMRQIEEIVRRQMEKMSTRHPRTLQVNGTANFSIQRAKYVATRGNIINQDQQGHQEESDEESSEEKRAEQESDDDS